MKVDLKITVAVLGSLVIQLAPAAGMVLMWMISIALICFILGTSFWLSALIGAIITPTDLVIASPIVTGAVAKKNLPDRIHHAISSVSGVNKGLNYLYIFLPLLILARSLDLAMEDWLKRTLLWKVPGTTAFGLVLGFMAGKLLRLAEQHNLVQ